jgi:hypothetical protein
MAIKIAGTEVINDNKELVLAKLTEIDASIADTAVDIFVYDTRKDSDGGAWRKRTQHTSWYNETLNTSTRGSRKEFPAVAVIVVDNANKRLTIYDGDDPDMPMWMIFTGDGTSTFDGTDKFLNATSYDYTCCSAVNGVVCMGSYRGSENNNYDYGLSVISFVDDTAARWLNNKVKEWPHGIGKRESALTFSPDDNSRSLVSGMVNDVAMTVLPNAPIDAATGLPVPTIAVATDGGVSVIKDDGTVVDISYPTATQSISFNADRLFMHPSASAVSFGSLPSSDVTMTSWRDGYYSAASVPAVISSAGTLKSDVTHGVVVTSAGVTFLDEDVQTPSNGMVAYTTSDYATGWMNGDIKLATLSDTDDTDVTGAELVTNGQSPISSTSGWSTIYSNSTLSINSDRLRATASGSGAYGFSRSISLDTSKKYTLTVTIDVDDASGGFGNFRIATNSSLSSGDTTIANSSGTYSYTFTPSASTMYVGMNDTADDSSNFLELVNLSVRLAEEDRSVNGNGLQVFGTVTKNPVATGADLVAYSGFSNSNYLEQPYNSDLPSGASDPFAVIMWFKVASVSATQVLLQFGTNATGELRQFNLNATGNPYFARSGQNTGNSRECEDDVWHHWATVHDGNKNISIYIDGQHIHTTNMTVFTDPSTDEPLYIANDHDGGNAFTGSLALLRISGTAPSPEQIKKIYEDEKVLFQENAQATLYGDSDAVTALAYDDSTELLHVGTSAGRSVFQGLRRVDNTTTAVGAAISASGGLVADE